MCKTKDDKIYFDDSTMDPEENYLESQKNKKKSTKSKKSPAKDVTPRKGRSTEMPYSYYHGTSDDIDSSDENYPVY